ncbi:MAG: CDP-diacylglycerol--serine O-phosphatidyltransferase [Planctomycetota bacterium]|nr:MAG: CDP-diacylglycerol--serine O-phosphatidyltransferase [Planctomycetota bacterium]
MGECTQMKRRLRLAVLPNLITLGNAVCGFAAIVKLATLRFGEGGVLLNPENLVVASWLILLAMFFDALDGKVARLTGSSSEFGGELDSLSDIISFGVAPALLVAMSNTTFSTSVLWGRVAWFFSLAFLLAVILRLARFNVENGLEEESHVSFKGLPSPAGAGVIASLVLLGCGEVYGPFVSGGLDFSLLEGLLQVLPVVALFLAYLMVSELEYTHVVSVLFRSKGNFEQLVLAIFGVIFVFLVPALGLSVLFLFYTLTGPVGRLRSFLAERADRKGFSSL